MLQLRVFFSCDIRSNSRGKISHFKPICPSQTNGALPTHSVGSYPIIETLHCISYDNLSDCQLRALTSVLLWTHILCFYLSQRQSAGLLHLQCWRLKGGAQQYGMWTFIINPKMRNQLGFVQPEKPVMNLYVWRQHIKTGRWCMGRNWIKSQDYEFLMTFWRGLAGKPGNSGPPWSR